MASLTRSERRSDDSPDLRFLSSPRHSHEHRPRSVVGPPAGAPLTRSRPAVFQHSNSNSGRATPAGRTKRGLDASERDLDALKPKRARIAVEILAKQRPVIGPDNVRVQPPRARPSGGAVGAETVVKPPQVPPAAEQQQPQHQQPRQQNIQPPQSTSSSAADVKEQNQFTAPTKHQEKVRKGIKHELDRLQPQPTDTSAPSGRKLRSQEATRFKSDLSAYFPDYDEIVGNDPKETHLLDLETPIIIVDSARKGTIGSASQSASLNYYPVRGYGDALFTDVVDCQRIDFSFLESQFKNKTLEDPLPDSTFEGVHKRAERLERSIRNTEKGRAYHEKDQIVRLLEGLQGHDWLRIMGISGITDSRKKSFESAREYFIKGCQAILDKFRNWTLEEKRRKQEKDRAIAEEAERAANDGSGDQEEEGDEHTSHAENGNDSSMAEEDTSSAGTSDVSSPAKQLREEALAHSRANKARSLKRPRAASKAVAAPPPKPPEPPKEFTSFFSKKYERDGAVNRHRRAGRKVLAWGLPVPDFQQTDFDLPETFRDEETMRTRARKKRKDKRSSRV